MRACMGVALVEMIDDSLKATTEVTSNVTKPNDIALNIYETHSNYNDTTELSIFENNYETDIHLHHHNKLEENNTVTNLTDSKEFKENGFYRVLLLESPVSFFNSITKVLNLKKYFRDYFNS